MISCFLQPFTLSLLFITIKKRPSGDTSEVDSLNFGLLCFVNKKFEKGERSNVTGNLRCDIL